jgi:hypothetical protein
LQPRNVDRPVRKPISDIYVFVHYVLHGIAVAIDPEYGALNSVYVFVRHLLGGTHRPAHPRPELFAERAISCDLPIEREFLTATRAFRVHRLAGRGIRCSAQKREPEGLPQGQGRRVRRSTRTRQ